MSTNMTLFSRIGGWFRRGRHDELLDGNETAIERSTFVRPRASVESVMASVQEGFTTLTELMEGIRSNLRENSDKQQQVLEYLAQLPEVVRSIPEQGRIHTEALKTVHQQLAMQQEAQSKLADVLQHISQSGLAQREAIDDLQDRLERMRQTDQQIADNLTAVGSAMGELSKTSTLSTSVLAEMRDGSAARDRDLERVLHRQGQRFTVMLSVAILLSVGALVAVTIVGYLMLKQSPGRNAAPSAPTSVVAPAR